MVLAATAVAAAVVPVIVWLAPSLVDVKVSLSVPVIDAVRLTPASDRAWLRSSSDLTVAVLAVAL